MANVPGMVTSPSVTLSGTELILTRIALDSYVSVVKRRINNELNRGIADILSGQLRELELLRSRL